MCFSVKLGNACREIERQYMHAVIGQDTKNALSYILNMAQLTEEQARS